MCGQCFYLDVNPEALTKLWEYFEMWCCRKMLKISLIDKLINEEVLGQA